MHTHTHTGQKDGVFEALKNKPRRVLSTLRLRRRQFLILKGFIPLILSLVFHATLNINT